MSLSNHLKDAVLKCYFFDTYYPAACDIKTRQLHTAVPAFMEKKIKSANAIEFHSGKGETSNWDYQNNDGLIILRRIQCIWEKSNQTQLF